MQCALHPDDPAIGACAACEKGACAACATYELDGAPCCDACGRAKEAMARDLGGAMLVFVGVGYLATLALGIVLFHARPVLGGIAAIVAIALGRGIQILSRPSSLRRRDPSASAST